MKEQEKKLNIKAEDFLFFLIEYAKLKKISQDKYNSHLWQQKMIFFIHWSYLHEKNELFFSDTFEAWPLGPVSFQLYKIQKEKSRFILTNNHDNTEIYLEKKFNNLEMWEHFKKIFEKYSKYTTWELVEESHKLKSWQKNFKSSTENIIYAKNIISIQDMKDDKYE